MSDVNKNALATQAYQTLIATLDSRNWKYEQHDDKKIIHLKVNGDDIPIDMILHVDTERQVLKSYSKLPFEMSEQKRVEGAVAACAASYGMADGCFDYDLGDGTLTYRVSTSFVESKLGEAAVNYLINCTCALVDHYNDMFLMLNKGMIDLGQFIQKCK